MRIVYASERPPYPFFLGGAARCAHQLLLTLNTEPGAQCMAIGSARYVVTPWSFPTPTEYASLGIKSVSNSGHAGVADCGYPVRVVSDFSRTLDALLAEFKPDIVWTQLEGARQLLMRARNFGIQGLYFVHDAETPAAELRAIAELGCHIVCSSSFLQCKVQEIIGREAHVIYPCPELYFDTRGNPDGYITMVNPHRVKGLNTFLEIARRLPAEKFLLLESWKLSNEGVVDLKQKLQALPNVRFMQRVSAMRAIYAQTKLLLVPSVWEEGFGMVAVEAQSCGIPVIASARGGLPESVGDGGVLIADYQNAAAWAKVIGMLLADPDAYRSLAKKALRHARAEAFTVAQSARRFLDICSGPVSRSSTDARTLSAMARGMSKVAALRALFRPRQR